jgi:prolyl-tRNA editing enzyme YbaK/EbsC (Cys-tRNA(Pro) deacylase)
VQYTHRLDISALQRALGAPGLALAADGARLAGFSHNGVSPFGMAAAVPVVWCKGALAGGGAVWVGGGEPDVKARVFAGALQKSGAAPAAVLDVSVPRSEEEWEGE